MTLECPFCEQHVHPVCPECDCAFQELRWATWVDQFEMLARNIAVAGGMTQAAIDGPVRKIAVAPRDNAWAMTALNEVSIGTVVPSRMNADRCLNPPTRWVVLDGSLHVDGQCCQSDKCHKCGAVRHFQGIYGGYMEHCEKCDTWETGPIPKGIDWP